MVDLYLHIGMHKTGSTSIQAAFMEGWERLPEHGVGYFSLGQNHSGALRGMFVEGSPKGLPPIIAKKLGVTPRSTSFDKSALSRLFDSALAANSAPKLIMSGEGLFGFRRDHVVAMQEHLSHFFSNIRIIVYVRDPLSWASSLAQGAIKKGGWTLDRLCDLEMISARKSTIIPRYRAGIEPYIEVFGREAVDIRVFGRDRLVDGDLIADFCSAIGEPSLAAKLSRTVFNPSLSYEAVLLIDVYMELAAARGAVRSRSESVEFRRRLEGLQGTRFALPRETLERVWAAVADDLDWLHATMQEEVFSEASYPPAATAGPTWSRATLHQLVELIEGGALSYGPPKRDRAKIRKTVEAVAQRNDERSRLGPARQSPSGLSETTLRQLGEAFGGSPFGKGRMPPRS